MLLIPLALRLFVSSSDGQEALLTNPQLLQFQIDQKKELAGSWAFEANIHFFLGMLVVVLGAVVALLQKANGKKWCSYAVAVIGILISALTFGTKDILKLIIKPTERTQR